MKVAKIFLTIESLIVIVSIPLFFKSVCINVASVCPAFLILLSLIQTMTFISASNDTSPHDTAYSANNTLTHEDYRMLCKIHAISKMLIIPVLVLFVFFFSSAWKLIAPIVIYIVSFLIAKAVFVKCSIKNRE